MLTSQLLACQQRCAATAAGRAIGAIALLLQKHTTPLRHSSPSAWLAFKPLAQNLLKALSTSEKPVGAGLPAIGLRTLRRIQGRHRRQAGSYKGNLKTPTNL